MKKTILAICAVVSPWIAQASLNQDFNLNDNDNTSIDIDELDLGKNELKSIIIDNCLVINDETNEIEFNKKCDDLLEDLIDGNEILAGGSICIPSR